jgi:hypothetical protein
VTPPGEGGELHQDGERVGEGEEQVGRVALLEDGLPDDPVGIVR